MGGASRRWLDAGWVALAAGEGLIAGGFSYSLGFGALPFMWMNGLVAACLAVILAWRRGWVIPFGVILACNAAMIVGNGLYGRTYGRLGELSSASSGAILEDTILLWTLLNVACGFPILFKLFKETE